MRAPTVFESKILFACSRIVSECIQVEVHLAEAPSTEGAVTKCLREFLLELKKHLFRNGRAMRAPSVFA